MQRPQGRKRALPQLEHTLCGTQVLEPVFPQITQGRIDQRGRRVAHQHLPAMPRRSDPSRTMQIRSHIPLVRHKRRPRMQPHPHTDRPLVQPLRDHRGRLKRIRRARERKEERVSLRIHLHADERHTRLTHNPPVIGKHPGICVRTKLLEQPGRALHIREQKRHRARRQIRAHQRIMRRDGKQERARRPRPRRSAR